MTDRLSLKTLDRLPGEVRRPSYDISSLGKGMVHLGVGAFHRAHQAVFTDDAIEAAGGDWGVTGISLRSPTAENQLAAQDGLFSVGTRAYTDESYRIIGNMREIITAPNDPAKALNALVQRNVSVVTLTITEKGYGLDPATGELSADHADIAHDLKMPKMPKTALGYLAKALELRREAGITPFTIVSCDNLPSNGKRLASALAQFARAVSSDFGKFVAGEVACPETMIDRIVPATTDDDRARVEAALGLRDEAYVKTEPFMQWVIEDRFTGPRPAWEEAGAMLVSEVAPYENAKLRLLNGPHSAIAYLGYLSGHEFVHDVMADETLGAFVEKLMDEEIAPTLEEPAGMALSAYAEELRSRFRNTALQHRTWQIAMDGSQKLPQRLLHTIHDRLESGQPFTRLATAVAAWIVYAGGKTPDDADIDVRDPLSERFAQLRREADGDADFLLGSFLAVKEVFGEDLAENPDFRKAVARPLNTILAKGSRAAAAEAS
ncbi:MAG: mannitol dehydrogenase family protein [Pseudomonadota bacterium]